MCHHLGGEAHDLEMGALEAQRRKDAPQPHPPSCLRQTLGGIFAPFLLYHFTSNWSGNQFDLHGLKIYLECDYFFPFHCYHPGVSLSVSPLHPSDHPHHSNLGTFKFSHVTPSTKGPAVASISLIPEVVFPSLAFSYILPRTPTPNSVLILIPPVSLLPMGLFFNCIVFA